MKRSNQFAAVATAVLLAACAVQTPEQRAEAAQRTAAAQVSAFRIQLQIDDMRCASYGAPRGSSVYVQCRQQADMLHQQQAQQQQFMQQGRAPSLLSAFGG